MRNIWSACFVSSPISTTRRLPSVNFCPFHICLNFSVITLVLIFNLFGKHSFETYGGGTPLQQRNAYCRHRVESWFYLQSKESEKIVCHPDFVRTGYEAQLKSIVLLKNKGQTLPMQPRSKVYIPKRYLVNQVEEYTSLNLK